MPSFFFLYFVVNAVLKYMYQHMKNRIAGFVSGIILITVCIPLPRNSSLNNLHLKPKAHGLIVNRSALSLNYAEKLYLKKRKFP